MMVKPYRDYVVTLVPHMTVYKGTALGDKGWNATWARLYVADSCPLAEHIYLAFAIASVFSGIFTQSKTRHLPHWQTTADGRPKSDILSVTSG
ncbi:hypothetical protein J6590_001097 [Homalodisca vitripennis]|nr:hypothetical protein J6590_001097 [Homalodisca vitripennis]